MSAPTAIIVIGTRAQLVKMAPVIRALLDIKATLKVVLTGQHRDSMDDLARDFRIGSVMPLAQLGVERSSVKRLIAWLPRALIHCYIQVRAVKKISSAQVVVHGDTLSTLLGAFVGWLQRVPVAHVESGLSSGQVLNPFPEELTRRAVFRLSDIAFCPNDDAVTRMRAKKKAVVIHTGENTVVDSLRYILANAPDVQLVAGEAVIVSLHRFENLYRTNRLHELVDQVLAVADQFNVVFVLHPATRSRLAATGLLGKLESHPSVDLRPRMSYTRFIGLLAHACAVITDGGSNQEELSQLGVPTIIMRQHTERPDGLGRNALMESDLQMTVSDYFRERLFEELRQPCSLNAAAQPSSTIVAVLINWRNAQA